MRSEINPGSHPEYHVELCHRHGKFCIGGVGSLALTQGTGLECGSKAEPWKQLGFYAKAARQHRAGIDGMGIYQTDSVYSQDELVEMAEPFSSLEACKARAREICERSPDGHWAQKCAFSPGLDWRSTTYGGFCLGPPSRDRL